MDAQKIALLAQEAEHKYALVPCGIMDQTIVAAGKAAHAMLLDCRDLSKKFIPIDPAKLRVVIVNSMVKHELTGGEYAERRKQCETAVAFFQKSNPKIKALRDVTIDQVTAAKDKLPDTVIFRRAATSSPKIPAPPKPPKNSPPASIKSSANSWSKATTACATITKSASPSSISSSRNH